MIIHCMSFQLFHTEKAPLSNMSYHSHPDVIYGDLSTYPPILRNAIDQCNAHPDCDAPQAYEVVDDTVSNYSEDEYGVVQECKSLREANEWALKYLIDEGFWTSSDGSRQDVEVRDGAF